MTDIAASTLARLKNKAKEQNLPLQQLLTLFCQEEFVRRLSHSTYKDTLILKGGFLLYAISGFTTRPTIDADYLLNNLSNDLNTIETVIKDVISTPSEYDFIVFELKSMETIAEFKEYHGIRIMLVGVIGRTKTPFSIDIGVGDVIIPGAIKRYLPVLLPNFKESEILTYSLESIISEKLEAIVSMMELTSRMKDFFDIYYLASHFDFDGLKLQTAIYETFTKRGTPFERDSITNIARLTTDKAFQNRWNNFCKRVLQRTLDLEDVIRLIIEFINPLFIAMIDETEYQKLWSSSILTYMKYTDNT